MLTIIFGILVIIACAAFGMMVGLVILGVGVVLMVLAFFGAQSYKKNLAQMKPTERICPMCQSTNIKFKYVTQGTSSSANTIQSSRTNARIRPGKGVGTTVGVSTTNGSTQIHNRNMAYCADCGYTFDFTSQEDIDAAYKKNQKDEASFILVGVVCAVLFVLLWRFMYGQT